MKTCPFCKISLKESLIHPDYRTCEKCKFTTKYKNFKTGKNDYIEIYDNEEKVIEGLKNDIEHYNNIKHIFPTEQYDKIIAFGGGFPKVESYLNTEEIYVVDFIPEVYEKYLDIFKDLYSFNLKNKNIKYIQGILPIEDLKRFLEKDLSISKHEKILFTFIHILEHLNFDDILKIFKDISELKEEYNDLEILIYQPNIEVAKDKNWFHFLPVEHVTFIPLEKYIEILESLKFDILKYDAVNDDLYILGG